MKKILFGQQGSTSLIALVTLAVIGGGLVTNMGSMEKMGQTVKSLNSQSESMVAIDKLRTLGTFLVSSNTVICKQGPFLGQKEGYRCKWTGKQLIDGSLVNIEKAKIGLDEGSYDENGFLVFDVDSSRILTPEEQKLNNIIGLKGRIGFKLYDAQEDKLALASRLERIPFANIIADNDRAMILIKVSVDYKEGDSSKQTVRQMNEYFSTRRPIAIPRMIVNQANCKRSCEISVGRNDNPACRGDQNFRYSAEVAVNAKTENLGPGVLYELKVQKDVVLDKNLFPNMANPAPVMVDAMPGKDYLMPGESVDWTDNMVCLEAKQTVEVYRLNGRCYDSSFTREVPCADKDDADNQHFVNAGTVSYNVDVSPFALASYNTVMTNLRKEFPDGAVQMSWRAPAANINKSLSRLEPARTVKKIVTTGTFPTKMDTTTRIIEIPPH